MGKSIWITKRRDILKFLGAIITIIIAFLWMITKSYFKLVTIINTETEQIFIFLTGYSLSNVAASIFAKDEISQKFDEMKDSILLKIDSEIENFNSSEKRIEFILEKQVDIICRGTIAESQSLVEERLKNATKVSNTCINTISKSNYWDDYTFDETNNRIANYVRDFIDNGGSIWIDIFSEKTKNRSSVIKSMISNNKKYTSVLLSEEISIINFIIIYKISGKNSFKELFFGFGLHDSDENGLVYSTNNEQIISTFEKYFRSLVKNHSKEI